jgi:hypothetical protein
MGTPMCMSFYTKMFFCGRIVVTFMKNIHENAHIVYVNLNTSHRDRSHVPVLFSSRESIFGKSGRCAEIYNMTCKYPVISLIVFVPLCVNSKCHLA